MQMTIRSSVIGASPRPEIRDTVLREAGRGIFGNLNDDLIGRTREVWRPRLGRDLSRDEVKQIAANVTGFFAILAEWSRADLPAPANERAGGATADDKGVRHDR